MVPVLIALCADQRPARLRSASGSPPFVRARLANLLLASWGEVFVAACVTLGCDPEGAYRNVERFGTKGKGISVYFRDPDGTLLEFISYHTST